MHKDPIRASKRRFFMELYEAFATKDNGLFHSKSCNTKIYGNIDEKETPLKV
jgi:hypothetical protein